MSNFIARHTLPDSWAEKSHCPICGMIPLWVLHQQTAPDEMNCPRCGTTFQVDAAGRHIYLMQTPPGFQDSVGDQWLPAKEIRAYAKRHPWKPSPPTQSVPVSPAQSSIESIEPNSPLPQSDMNTAQLQPEAIPDFVENELPKVSTERVEKARELYELGNSRYKIRMILMETEKISSEEVDEIMYVAFQEEDKKNQRQNRTVLIIGGILILLCLCSVIAVSVFRRVSSTVSPSIEDIGQPPIADQDPSNQNQPEEDDGINIPFLPDSVEQLMPLLSGEPPDFPEPQVQQGAPTGNQVYTCPTDSTTAANLFGGSAVSWTMTTSPLSWAYFSLSPTTLYIPRGLTGEILYFDEAGGGTRSATGPATIQNATIILIMCE